jgi:hypothetical protein
MADVISEYQKWKQQGENLRAQARQAMESRYRELLVEAAQLAGEYRRDFGAAPKNPPQVTAFRFKGSTKSKQKKSGAAKPVPASKQPAPAAKPEKPAAKPEPRPKAPKPDRKATALQKRLEAARKKLDDAKAAGAPTRVLEDRIYEIEDELRLAGQIQ